ncbi:histidine phosphatase family protein [Wenjunlia tyrosinilytica]|uniref:Phosphoglycerate mutase n=1 Tax=Wenjunlia tyrosinilytica TaxID=1544741 RepID=A0A917ZNN2_9ACTN|nr:histidine phosphatase family protein [Wenjunlia tyrosinilytica]GGO87429.1 phosphoglycerate mutase [Wenjunlia tyrosinilytica]
MAARVMFVSPAESGALREARVDDDGPLSAVGRRRAVAAAAALPMASRRFSSPSARCRETAAALGVEAAPEPGLRDCAMGRWRGRRLDELSAAEPEGVAAWLSDPAAAPHGGESLLDLCSRVGAWLDTVPSGSGRVLAVVEPGVVRAALVHALGLPPAAFWRLDVPPLSLTEVTGGGGRWNLRCGRPLDAGSP